MAAELHWLALDRAFSHIISAPQAAKAHLRFARRASALSGIYLPRLLDAAQRCLDDADSKRQLSELRETCRRLAAALDAAWHESPER